jgi:hypothetical protein
VINDLNRTGLGIEVDFFLPAESVVHSLNHIIEWRGKPTRISFDHTPKYNYENPQMRLGGITPKQKLALHA